MSKHLMESVSVTIHLNSGSGVYQPEELQSPKITMYFHDDPKNPYFTLYLGETVVFMTLEQADELKFAVHNAIQKAVTL